MQKSRASRKSGSRDTSGDTPVSYLTARTSRVSSYGAAILSVAFHIILDKPFQEVHLVVLEISLFKDAVILYLSVNFMLSGGYPFFISM